MSAAEIVNKVWNYAHVLRNNGVGYGDYVEAAPTHPCSAQIVYLIFLKMADERLAACLGDSSYSSFRIEGEKVIESASSYQPTPSPQSSPSHLHPDPLPEGEGEKGVPKKYSWAELVRLDDDDLELQYRHTRLAYARGAGRENLDK